jgi:hypothetical protein
VEAIPATGKERPIHVGWKMGFFPPVMARPLDNGLVGLVGDARVVIIVVVMNLVRLTTVRQSAAPPRDASMGWESDWGGLTRECRKTDRKMRQSDLSIHRSLVFLGAEKSRQACLSRQIRCACLAFDGLDST